MKRQPPVLPRGYFISPPRDEIARGDTLALDGIRGINGVKFLADEQVHDLTATATDVAGEWTGLTAVLNDVLAGRYGVRLSQPARVS